MTRYTRAAVAVLALLVLPLTGAAQRGRGGGGGAPAGWNDPFPPHRVMDNLYYVGTSMLAVFLVTTPEGHILINGGYEATVPVIQDAVEELGFRFEDVRILLSAHAHPDHAEADALIKELTGAQVVTSRAEAPALREFRPGGKEHPIDRMLDDGDQVTLGGTTLTAHVMPGHTKGCTAWEMELTENGQTYRTLIECSLNTAGIRLVGNEDYPNIVEDYRATFAKARSMLVDIFVSSHGVFYGLNEKYEKLEARGPEDPNPFVDPEGYLAHIDEYEAIFNRALEQQRAAAPAN